MLINDNSVPRLEKPQSIKRDLHNPELLMNYICEILNTQSVVPLPVIDVEDVSDLRNLVFCLHMLVQNLNKNRLVIFNVLYRISEHRCGDFYWPDLLCWPVGMGSSINRIE